MLINLLLTTPGPQGTERQEMDGVRVLQMGFARCFLSEGIQHCIVLAQ